MAIPSDQVTASTVDIQSTGSHSMSYILGNESISSNRYRCSVESCRYIVFRLSLNVLASSLQPEVPRGIPTE